MDVRRKMPHPAIRSVVRSFEERRGTLGPGGLTWPLAARPHQIVEAELAVTHGQCNPCARHRPSAPGP
jgi:hypothetical protein